MNFSRHHVAAGSFTVGPKQPQILQAFLGTCVGVAVQDRQANVGGMAHLLLPEPVTPGSTFGPERYAATGMPMFIDALREAGAARENMSATVAGGAFVGPVKDQDLNLDIGGRTADVVESILDAEGIAIERSETGGFFTCSLNLNMSDWSCLIEPAGQEKLLPEEQAITPDIDQIRRDMTHIQPIPQVALKILRIIDEESYNIQKIAEEVQQDQVISAQTLKLCNSAMFAKKTKIESLEHALVYLGQDLLVKLIISAALKEFYGNVGQGYSLCKGGLYHHAVGTAIIAEKIAHFTGEANPSTAYTAGLLHDIGKVVLDQHIASAFPYFYRRFNESEEDLETSEKKILGTDHTHIGAELARNWSFPESLQAVIHHHHHPEDAAGHAKLAHTVYLADLLMSRFHTGLEMERINTRAVDHRLNRIGLQTSQFNAIVDLIPKRVLETSPETAIGG